MEVSDEKVTVNFKGVSKKVAIEDATKEKLKRIFKCNVDYLEEVDTGEIVFIENVGKKLKAGSSYKIETETPQVDINVNQQDNLQNWLRQNKNKVQHALVLSDATYSDNAEEFLQMSLSNHSFKSLAENKFGKCRFLIAETENDSTVYIAFRGTKDFEDLLVDFSFWLQEAQRNPSSGSFHSGFLEKAELFPLRELFLSNFIENKTLVFCGHSLGGAVSSIIYTELVILRHRLGNTMFSDVSNITFGAPLFADTDFREYLTSISTNLEMYHFVVKNDPVPSLLSFGSLLKALQKLHQQHGLFQRIVTVPIFAELVSALKPYLEFALKSMVVASDFNLLPENYGKSARLAKTVLQLVDTSESETVKRMFVPIGNFMIIDNPNVLYFSHALQTRLETEINIWENVGVECLLKHNTSNYKAEITVAEICHMGSFDTKKFKEDGDSEQRTVERMTEFEPTILHADLCMLIRDQKLRVAIEGRHLTSIILQDCRFHFGGLHFDATQAEVKKLLGNRGDDRVIIEQLQTQIKPNFSPLGCKIEVATQFGSCEYIIKQDGIRNLESMSTIEISKHESVSLVIRKSIQRGIALAEIRGEHAPNDLLTQKIFELANLCLNAAEIDEFRLFLRGNCEQILSDETQYTKVENFCMKIERAVSTQIQINMNKTNIFLQKFLQFVSSALEMKKPNANLGSFCLLFRLSIQK